jgi:hypothetical protein
VDAYTYDPMGNPRDLSFCKRAALVPPSTFLLRNLLIDKIDPKDKRMKSFQEWCELSGRRWMGAASYEEFKKNAEDYEVYLSATAPVSKEDKREA